jgi:hypothetical protein
MDPTSLDIYGHHCRGARFRTRGQHLRPGSTPVLGLLTQAFALLVVCVRDDEFGS